MRLDQSPSSLIQEAPAGGDAPAPAADLPLRAKAQKAAEKFEAFFIAEMFRQMRKSAREFGDHDGPGRDRPNDDMLDLAHTMVADALAGQHAFGVADLILRQVLPTPPAAAAENPGFNSSAPAVALNK